jgi:hypothetical protein
MGVRAVGHSHGHGSPGHHHGGHDGSAHHPGAPGHGHHSPGHPASHAQTGHDPGSSHSHANDHTAGKEAARSIWSWASPRVWFSVLVGAGATGLIAKGFLVEPMVAGLAIVGGLAFERLLVGPFWNFLLQFESRPALTLESALYEEVSAETDFDIRGEGLVALELDGQIVQLLGRLTPIEALGERVRRGARLRIEEIDTGRNRCLVSRIGSLGSGESP